MPPTADSHFATKGYVDNIGESVVSQFSPTLLYEDSFTITGSTSRKNKSNINFGYKMLILEYDLTNVTISEIDTISTVSFYFLDNESYTLRFIGHLGSSSEYKKKYTCMMYASFISTRNESVEPIIINFYEAGSTTSNIVYADFDYVMTANRSYVFNCTTTGAPSISGSMIYRIYGLYAF